MTPEPGEIVRDLLGDLASMECGCIVDRQLCFCLLCLKCEAHCSCTDQERAAAHEDRLQFNDGAASGLFHSESEMASGIGNGQATKAEGLSRKLRGSDR